MCQIKMITNLKINKFITITKLKWIRAILILIMGFISWWKQRRIRLERRMKSIIWIARNKRSLNQRNLIRMSLKGMFIWDELTISIQTIQTEYSQLVSALELKKVLQSIKWLIERKDTTSSTTRAQGMTCTLKSVTKLTKTEETSISQISLNMEWTKV